MATPLSRNIPGGRGRFSGPDAFLSQQEAYRSRKDSVAAQGGLLYSFQGQDYVVASVGSGGAALVASTFYMIPMPAVATSMDVFESRVRVTTGDAGKTLYTALYNFNPTNKRFTQVASSAAKFACDATGIASYIFPSKFTLSVEDNYWMGIMADTGTAVFQGQTTFNGQLVNTLSKASHSAPFQPTYSTQGFTKSTLTISFPLLVYLSKLGNYLL